MSNIVTWDENISPTRQKPRIIQDYCIACDAFGPVARHGHLVRGICKHCLGRLLNAFKLPHETEQKRLFK